jgi:riboflavin kinase / FMN adenylyltransferase
MPVPSVVPLRDHLHEARTRGAVLAIGNFDGVHAGHRTLLAHAAELARRGRAPLCIVSFFPPAKVLFTGSPYLCSREEKHALLAELGPDEVVIEAFDRAFAATPASAFVDAVTALEPAAIVVGEDFRFGRGRGGTTEDLGRAAPRVEVLRLVSIGGEVVKSSLVREAIQAGDLARANRLLGAPYLVIGEVEQGDRRGHTIGFPTANLRTDPGKALPPGVYAVTVEIAGGPEPAEARPGMANVGTRPSFASPPPSLEAHLFDFSGDLYGRRLAVRFHAKLRDQQRFDSLDALRNQLAADELAARSALGASPEGAGPRLAQEPPG